jgi:CRISPR-associated protein Csm5
MSAFIQQHRCTLSTLGPVHLGTGEDYLPTHYIINDGYLHAFNDMALLKGLGPQGLNNLLSIVERGDASALLAVRREILRHKDQLIPLASHSVWVHNGISSLYQQRVVNVAQVETGREARTINNALKIARIAANPFSHIPELTGSAIKGAIRTAWLDALLKKNPQAKNDRDFKRDHSKVLLQNRSVTDDPFYSLKVSDATYQHAAGLAPTETLFAVGVRRKRSEKFGAHSLNTMLECLSPWRDRCFNFDIRFLDNRLRTETGKDSGMVPTSLAEMAKACNDYYLPKLYDELAQLGDEGRYLDDGWVRSFKTLLSGQSPLLKALLEQKAMLLRIGKHSGAEDKTLNGAHSIKIIIGQGQAPEYRANTTQVRLAGSQQNQQTNLLPFGWVVIEFDDTHIPELRQVMRNQSAPARARMIQEQQRLQEKAVAAKRQEEAFAAQQLQAAEAEAKRMAEEQAERERQAKRKAEAEAKRLAEEQAEQARQAALAAMPPEKRAIAELQQAYIAGKGDPANLKDQGEKGRGPGSPLYTRAREQILQASDWNTADKTELKALILEIFALLGVNPKNGKPKDLLKTLNS